MPYPYEAESSRIAGLPGSLGRGTLESDLTRAGRGTRDRVGMEPSSGVPSNCPEEDDNNGAWGCSYEPWDLPFSEAPR